jgi:putative restriction endonuclease
VADRAIEPQATLRRLSSLRQNQYRGRRAPHKPLLVLLVLGRLANTGSSQLRWAEAVVELGELIAEFGPPSHTSHNQSAAYPFTRLRSDGVWTLDHPVPMDRVAPLAEHDVAGQLEASVESALHDDRHLLYAVARSLVESHFPPTIAPDVLTAVGLEPDLVLRAADAELDAEAAPAARRRDPRWRTLVLQAWDRQCAFCGYDGQAGGACVGVEAAHVRWFAFDGPDSLDNGLALCVLHHKLFDLGVMGLDHQLRIRLSEVFTARTSAGRAQYDLHGRHLQPRPGTSPPATTHIDWHNREVFKGNPLIA